MRGKLLNLSPLKTTIMSKGKFTSNNTEIPFQIFEICCLYGCKIAQANRKTKTLNNSSTISFG